MTVKELLAQLEVCNPEREIFVSVDNTGTTLKQIDEISFATSQKLDNNKKIDGFFIFPLDN